MREAEAAGRDLVYETKPPGKKDTRTEEKRRRDAQRTILESMLKDLTLGSEQVNSLERVRNRFLETEALFHGGQPGASTHRLGRACPTHCYPLDKFDTALSPRPQNAKLRSAKYSFSKAQRAVAARHAIHHNGMGMSPRDLEK